MSFKKRNCPIPPCPKGSSEQGILGRYNGRIYNNVSFSTLFYNFKRRRVKINFAN